MKILYILTSMQLKILLCQFVISQQALCKLLWKFFPCHNQDKFIHYYMCGGGFSHPIKKFKMTYDNINVKCHFKLDLLVNLGT